VILRKKALATAAIEVVADSAADRISVVAGSTGTYYGQPMVAGELATIVGGGTASCETSRRSPMPASCPKPLP